MNDHLCGVLTHVGGVSQYEVDCGGAVGNTIGVYQKNQILSLCEVEVFAPQPGWSLFIINFSIFNLKNIYWSEI